MFYEHFCESAGSESNLADSPLKLPSFSLPPNHNLFPPCLDEILILVNCLLVCLAIDAVPVSMADSTELSVCGWP